MQTKRMKGLDVSALVLGTVQLGIPYGIANQGGLPPMEDRYRIIQAALAGGINTLDTASAYGESEAVIGEFIKKHPHTDVPNIVTKVSGMKPGLTEKEAFDYVTASVERSLALLGLECIPIVLLHRFQEWEYGGNGAVQGLKALKADGKIKMAGISLYNEDDMERVLAQPVFESVQIPLNIFDQKLIHSGVLDAFKERDMMVFVRSIYLQGALFLEPSKLTGALKEGQPYIEKLRSLAAREGLSIAELAVAFVRDLPGVTGLVLGSETVEQVNENIALMDVPALSEGFMEELKETFQHIPPAVIDPRCW